MVYFIIGLFIGAFLGFLFAAMFAGGKRADEVEFPSLPASQENPGEEGPLRVH